MKFRSDRQRRKVMAQLQSGRASSARSYSLAQLQYLNARRTPAALMLDLVLSNRHTIAPSDPRVVSWIKHPGAWDVEDVDTPGSDLPVEQRLGRNTFKIDPLAGDLFTLKLPLRGRSGALSPQIKKRRQENQAALQQLHDALTRRVQDLQRQIQGDPTTRRALRRDLRSTELELHNAKMQLDAYHTGSFLLIGQRRDQRLVREYARLLERSFQWNPKTLDVAALYIGTTREPGAAGYTHSIHNAAYRVPFIAINEATYNLNQPLTAKASRKRRLTMIHEAVHVSREHEAGRTVPETRAAAHYGAGRADEEKHTVLETQLRAGSQGNLRTESYYAYIPDAPTQAGATDNRITLKSRKPRIVRSLPVLNRFMHRNAAATYIDRLDFKGGRWTGKRSPRNVDRVLRTSDGYEIEVYNPNGTRRDVARFVDSLDGDRGDGIQEYRDGHLRTLQRKSRRRPL